MALVSATNTATRRGSSLGLVAGTPVVFTRGDRSRGQSVLSWIGWFFYLSQGQCTWRVKCNFKGQVPATRHTNSPQSEFVGQVVNDQISWTNMGSLVRKLPSHGKRWILVTGQRRRTNKWRTVLLHNSRLYAEHNNSKNNNINKSSNNKDRLIDWTTKTWRLALPLNTRSMQITTVFERFREQLTLQF